MPSHTIPSLAGGRSNFDLRPLLHPVWGGALALLLINDNFLKGQGLVPGWLTGKLSDFAFLVVAPVLFAAILPVVLPHRRTMALSSVVGLYTAADLSPAVSDAVVRAARGLGLFWLLWPDPTDLLALAVLPVTVWLMRHRCVEPYRVSSRGEVVRGRLSLIVGALACVATSAPPNYPHFPYLVNGTTTPVEVRFTWVLRRTPCPTTTAAGLAATLTAGDLSVTRSAMVTSGEVAALDGEPAPSQSPVGQCRLHEHRHDDHDVCVAAILEAAGATPVVMVVKPSWQVYSEGAFFSCSERPAPISQCSPKLTLRPDFGGDALALMLRGGQLTFVAGEAFDIAPVDLAALANRPTAADGCAATLQAHTALTQDIACQTDVDCRAVPLLPLRRSPSTCDAAYVSFRVDGTAIEALVAQWRRSCVATSAAFVCSTYQPPTCRAGRCEPLCPGIEVPLCPQRCTISRHGEPCGREGRCLDVLDRFCECTGDLVECKTPPFAAPDCPLTCLSRTPGPVSVPDAAADATADSDATTAADATADSDGTTAVDATAGDLTVRDGGSDSAD